MASLLRILPVWLLLVPIVVEAEAPRGLDLYLLIGQSNMAGRAPIEPEDDRILPRVYLFNEDGAWEPATNPLNRYSSVRKNLSMQRLSLGFSFAERMTEAEPGRLIGLVMNARGGTRIEEWAAGEQLYEEAVARARAARETGSFRGVLWHQGEGNSRDPDYLQKLADLIAALRRDLGEPDLPVVVGQVEGNRPVNAQLAAAPAAIPHTAVARSEGLTTYDGTHFDTASTREFGRRYAEAMKELRGLSAKGEYE